MPDWLQSILDTGSGIVTNAQNNQALVTQAQIQASTVAAQQAQMANMVTSQSILSSGNTKTYMMYGAGILLFTLLLRQTSQAR